MLGIVQGSWTPQQAAPSAYDPYMTLTAPTGIEAGDLILAMVAGEVTTYAGSTDGMGPPPDGWASIAPTAGPNGWLAVTGAGFPSPAATQVSLYYRYAERAEESGQRWTWPSIPGGTVSPWVNAVTLLVRSTSPGRIGIIDTVVIDTTGAGISPALTPGIGAPLELLTLLFTNAPSIGLPSWGMSGSTILDQSSYTAIQPMYEGASMAAAGWLATFISGGSVAQEGWTIPAPLGGYAANSGVTMALREAVAVPANPPLVDGGWNLDPDTGAMRAQMTVTGHDNRLPPADSGWPTLSGHHWTVTGNCGLPTGVAPPFAVLTPGWADYTTGQVFEFASTAGGDMTLGDASTLPVTAGTAYTWAAQVAPASGWARLVRIDYEWTDNSGTPIGGWNLGPPVLENAAGWVTVWSSDTAPTGAHRVKIRIAVLATGGAAEAHAFVTPTMNDAQPGLPLLIANDGTGNPATPTASATAAAWWRLDEQPPSCELAVTTVTNSAPAGGPDGTVVGALLFGQEAIGIPTAPDEPGMAGTGTGGGWLTTGYTLPGGTDASIAASILLPKGSKPTQTIILLPGSLSLALSNGTLRVDWNVGAGWDDAGLATDLSDGEPHWIEVAVGSTTVAIYVDGIQQLGTTGPNHTIASTAGAVIGGVGSHGGSAPATQGPWMVGVLGQVAAWESLTTYPTVEDRYTAWWAIAGVTTFAPGNGASPALTDEAQVETPQGWVDVRFGNGQTPGANTETFPVIYDYEVIPLAINRYRARVIGGYSGYPVIGPFGRLAVVYGAFGGDRWFILDPLDPGGAVAVDLSSDPQQDVKEQGAVFYPLGRSTAIKSTDGTKGQWDGAWVAHPETLADRNALLNLLTGSDVLLIQSPLGEQGYVMKDPGTAPSGKTNLATSSGPVPWFDVSFAVLTAPRP